MNLDADQKEQLMMDADKQLGEPIEVGPHFSAEAETDSPPWEEIEAGRFMPRRIRGSFRGRALG